MVEAQSPFANVARKIGNPRLEKVLAQLAANIATEVHSAERIPSEVRSAITSSYLRAKPGALKRR